MSSLNRLVKMLVEESEKSALKLPDSGVLTRIMDLLRLAMFPRQLGPAPATPEVWVRDALTEAEGLLKEQLSLIWPDENDRISGITDKLFEALPHLQSLLKEDIEAAVENDPVGPDPAEVIVSYPSFQALVFQRIAHHLSSAEIPLLPRLIAELAHSQTGIDIHSAASLGPRCFIDHGTGVVIGATALTGRGVTIYQGVTLGAKSFPRDPEGNLIKGQKRHPTIGDFCTIYAGATILGPVSVGHHSVIGGNVWITRDVPAYSQVTQRRYHQELFSGYGDGI